MARSTAASVPGCGASHESAHEAVFESLGSTTISLAPAFLASMIRCA